MYTRRRRRGPTESRKSGRASVGGGSAVAHRAETTGTGATALASLASPAFSLSFSPLSPFCANPATNFPRE